MEILTKVNCIIFKIAQYKAHEKITSQIKIMTCYFLYA